MVLLSPGVVRRLAFDVIGRVHLMLEFLFSVFVLVFYVFVYVWACVYHHLVWDFFLTSAGWVVMRLDQCSVFAKVGAWTFRREHNGVGNLA